MPLTLLAPEFFPDQACSIQLSADIGKNSRGVSTMSWLDCWLQLRHYTRATLINTIAAGSAIATVAAFGTTTASAQVGYADQFTATSWQLGSESRTAARARSSRRNAVTTTTNLEDFDVPRRPAVRRAATPNRSAASRRAQPRRAERVKPVRRVAVTRTRVQVAALGPAATPTTVRPPATSLTGGAIAWRASSACLAGNLRAVVGRLASAYGSVTVNSTCRSATRNRRVGGARRSWHLTGNAVDFRIHGANVRSVYAYLRSTVGGLKHYGGGRFHIDNGPRRTF